MINSCKYKPRIIPVKGTGDSAEIDRAQSLEPTKTLNRERAEEIGRCGVVGYIKKSPAIAYRMTQHEYGNIEFWQKIVNNENIGGAADGTGITLNSFTTPYFDLCAYLTDADDTFKGTVYYPSLRTAGFSLTIGDPQAIIERSFDFVGEAAKILQNDNQYLIFQKETPSAGSDVDITLDNTATENPDISGAYMLRVVRISSSGTVTELSKSDGDYTENATTVTIATVASGDTIKLWYTSSSSPSVIFTENDSDKAAIVGDSVDIYLYIPASGKPSSSDYIYRLQSVTLDVAFEREDLREIGNKNVVQRGVNNSTVSVTLGRIVENFTVEEVLRGVASDYGILDIEKLTDSAALIIKIYDDNDKKQDTFKYGFKAVGLSPMELRGAAAAVNEHVSKDDTLEGEDLTISANTSVLGI